MTKFLGLLIVLFTAFTSFAGDHSQDPSQDPGQDQGRDVVTCNYDEWRCVARCTYRTSEGECRTYGADYCGYNARCVPYCEYRDQTGSCRNYGKDVCGSGQDYRD